MTTTSADIQKYESSSDGNIYYFIKVVFNGREWAVRKRYSDFSKLDEFLQKDGIQMSYALPSKQFWNRFDKKTLTERQKGLQSYLNTLLKNTVSSDNSLVKEFLEVDHNRLEHLRKQSFHALKRTERMESVVSVMSRSVIYMPVKNTTAVQPVTISRARQGSGAGTPSFGSGPSMQKSKSLSFSMKFSFSSSSRKNSFQPEARQSFVSMERKNSLDFVPSSNKSSSVDVATLKDLLKKEAYEYGVNALWERYESEINTILAESDYMLPQHAHNTHSNNVSYREQHREHKRYALPVSHYRVRSADSPVTARKKLPDLLACMSQPVAKIGDNSVQRFLDAHLRQKKLVNSHGNSSNHIGLDYGNTPPHTPTTQPSYSQKPALHRGTTNGSMSPSRTEMLGIAECERESEDCAARESEEDQPNMRDSVEFVNMQRKYNALVYLVEQS